MVVRIGSAASPRWWDLTWDRLDRFVDALASWGATSTELVLHAGAADAQIARVHILEPDWDEVARRFQAKGIVCHAHAPLHPRFKLDRWQGEQDALQEAFRPVLAAVNRFSARQSVPCVLVVHAASDADEHGAEATAEFCAWATRELALGGARLALELRKPAWEGDPRIDRRRDRLGAFVRELGTDRVGICWDVAHDWEGGRNDPEWRPEPSPDFLERVVHVHVHGSGRYDGAEAVHFPLQADSVPWQAMLSPLIAGGYDGAITIEARYRFARALGEPWPVLEASFALLATWLAEQASAKCCL